MVQKKQANKPVKTNLKSKKGILKIVFILLVVALIVTVIYALVSDIASRKTQLDSLNRASDDLHQLYTDIVGSVAVVDGTSSYSKKCFQASAKFSKGEIVCGGEGGFIADIYASYESQKKSSVGLIKKTHNFEYKKTEDILNNRTGAVDGFVVHFIHRDTLTKCVQIVDKKRYQMNCTMSAPDFLPGYEIEE